MKEYLNSKYLLLTTVFVCSFSKRILPSSFCALLPSYYAYASPSSFHGTASAIPHAADITMSEVFTTTKAKELMCKLPLLLTTMLGRCWHWRAVVVESVRLQKFVSACCCILSATSYVSVARSKEEEAWPGVLWGNNGTCPGSWCSSRHHWRLRGTWLEYTSALIPRRCFFWLVRHKGRMVGKGSSSNNNESPDKGGGWRGQKMPAAWALPPGSSTGWALPLCSTSQLGHAGPNCSPSGPCLSLPRPPLPWLRWRWLLPCQGRCPRSNWQQHQSLPLQQWQGWHCMVDMEHKVHTEFEAYKTEREPRRVQSKEELRLDREERMWILRS